MKQWLAAKVSARVFATIWLLLMVLMTGAVVGAWITFGLHATAPRFMSALVFTLVTGLPIAREWRHAKEVLGRPL